MVPTFTWGLSRSNLAFATLGSLLLVLENRTRRARLRLHSSCGRTFRKYRVPSVCAARSSEFAGLLAVLFPELPLGDVRRHFFVALELHRVGGAALGV